MGSIPSAAASHPSGRSALSENTRGQEGADKADDDPVPFFYSAARVTTDEPVSEFNRCFLGCRLLASLRHSSGDATPDYNIRVSSNEALESNRRTPYREVASESPATSVSVGRCSPARVVSLRIERAGSRLPQRAGIAFSIRAGLRRCHGTETNAGESGN